MVKLGCLAMALLVSLNSFSQRERVHVDLTRYSCKAGDTIFLKGTVMKGPHLSSVSKNLCTELFTDNGTLLQRYLFPIVHGQSIGFIIVPDTLATGNYYLLALTRQQLNYDTANFFSVPIMVYNKEKPATIYHKQQVSPPVVAADMIKGIYWLTTLYKDKVSSLLEIDSGSRSRHLQLIDPLAKDSVLGRSVQLDGSAWQKYSLFPLQPERDSVVLFLLEDSVLIGRQVIRLRDRPAAIQLTTDTLDTSPLGPNVWTLDLPSQSDWYATIDVTDADRSLPSPEPITRLNDCYTDNLTIRDSLVDTAYISFIGKASRASGKEIKDRYAKQIVISGCRDSIYLFTKAVDMDAEGNFKLDSLFFFGAIGLQFQINGEEGFRSKDVKISLAGFTPPRINPMLFTSNWEDGVVTIGAADTAYTKTELERHDLSQVKTLQAAVVRHWKNRRQELDDTYTSGPFSEPAMYYYDLRNDSSDYNRDIFWYINSENGRLRYDPVADKLTDVLGHPIHYFVDEHEYPDYALRAFEFDRLAYIKILECDCLSTKENQFTFKSSGPSTGLGIPIQQTALNVCIYTRKGKDYRTMRGGMKGMAIKGYSEVFPFAPDSVTLFWHPLESGHSFRISFNNSATTKRFRVKVEGVNANGDLIHYETVVPK